MAGKYFVFIAISIFLLNYSGFADAVTNPGEICVPGPKGNDYCDSKNVDKVSQNVDGGGNLEPAASKAELLKKFPNGKGPNIDDQNIDGAAPAPEDKALAK